MHSIPLPSGLAFNHSSSCRGCSRGRRRLRPRQSARYLTAEGNHLAGDRIFWLVAPEEAGSGEHETIVHIHGGDATSDPLEQGRLEATPAGWVWNLRTVRR